MRRLFFLIWLFPFVVNAQEFRKCPAFDQEEKWETIESFRKNEADVVNLMEWIVATPPTEQLVERSAASIFVMEWATKNPNYTFKVELAPYQQLLINEDLMLAYVIGNIHYAVKHMNKLNADAQRLAGLKALLFQVEHSESLSKDKLFKHLLKANRKGKLNEFDKESVMNQNTSDLLENNQVK
mgnify:CR=1 FL=1